MNSTALTLLFKDKLPGWRPSHVYFLVSASQTNCSSADVLILQPLGTDRVENTISNSLPMFPVDSLQREYLFLGRLLVTRLHAAMLSLRIFVPNSLQEYRYFFFSEE
jgi:hypothetical protein